MKLTFVNVGYGEAILLQEKQFTALIDGGSGEAEEFADRSSGRIPLVEYLRRENITEIDLMISTHTHEDHLCGLFAAAKLAMPKTIWQTVPADFCETALRVVDPAIGRNPSQKKFLQALMDHRTLSLMAKEQGCRIVQMAAGMEGELCEGLRFRVLSPTAEREEELASLQRETFAAEGEEFFDKLTLLDARMNNYSLMLVLDWHGTIVLLPGDTNSAGYSGIDPEALKAHIFKVGHHGQKDGADQTLLDKVGAEAVICCASSDRRYNSAHPDLIRAITQKSKMYFSDCPPIPEGEVPVHSALQFTLGEGGQWTAEYK